MRLTSDPMVDSIDDASMVVTVATAWVRNRTSMAVVTGAHERGLEIPAATAFAHQVGIDRVLADVLREDKVNEASDITLAAFDVLNPVVAGAAMGFSSVNVVTNSLQLRRFGRDTRQGLTAIDSETADFFRSERPNLA